jgi:hypothetical protein
MTNLKILENHNVLSSMVASKQNEAQVAVGLKTEANSPNAWDG